MLIYPAIDLRGGRCVRLQQGERERETVYSSDPLETAKSFAAQGAQWLHIVDLDGAFAGENNNRAIIKKIAASVPVRIQCGGGIRTLDDVAELLDAGVTRAILGTVAVREPEVVRSAVEKFSPKALAVAIDARDGFVSVRGWQQTSTIDMVTFAQSIASSGIELVIYTDIANDGMLSGVNLEGVKAILDRTSLRLIASGGVRDRRDVQQLQALNNPRLDGVILGRSLYEGTIALSDAIKLGNGFMD
jgi:phosphoribosylformimino-5-aminoimidazole carboxamide ribotide isomerase